MRAHIAALMERARTHPSKSERTKAENEASRLKVAFLERLKNFRVLDPACGSGNFLYLALKIVDFITHATGQYDVQRAIGDECFETVDELIARAAVAIEGVGIKGNVAYPRI